MNADVGPGADGRHRLSFGEDLGVRPDANFQILRPDALRDERALDGIRLGRAGTNIAQVVADDRDDRLPHRLSLAGIAACLLFDHALEEAGDERHTAGLDRLKIAWREQPWGSRVSRLFAGIAEHV